MAPAKLGLKQQMAPVRGSRRRGRGQSSLSSPVVAAEEENAPDSAGPVQGTPAGPRVSTRARGSISAPADDTGEAADTDSLGSAPAGSGTQPRFTKKQVRDQILKITTLLERTQKTLKASDRWIEAGVLVRNHGLDATQTALESVLDLLELRLKKLEAAKASSTRLVPQATINLLRVLLDDLTQLASLEPANLAIDWVDKRKALGTILGVNLRVDRSRMVRPGPTNQGQAETAAETGAGSDPRSGSGTGAGTGTRAGDDHGSRGATEATAASTGSGSGDPPGTGTGAGTGSAPAVGAGSGTDTTAGPGTGSGQVVRAPQSALPHLPPRLFTQAVAAGEVQTVPPEVVADAQIPINTRDDLTRALLTVGKGLPVDLNGRGVNHFLKVNSTTDLKFTGSGNSLSFQTYWERILPIHLAPEAQISINQKVGGMIYLLGGEAKEALQDFHEVNTISGYFRMWRALYDAFGIRRRNGAWLTTFMSEKQHLLCTDVKQYLVGLISTLERHEKNGEDLNALALQAWVPLQEMLRKDYGDFCEDWPNFKTVHRTYDNVVASNPYLTLTEFITFKMMRIENRENAPTRPGYSMMRTIVRRNKKQKDECTLSTDEDTSESEEELTSITVAAHAPQTAGNSQGTGSGPTPSRRKKKKNKNKPKQGPSGQGDQKESQGQNDQVQPTGTKVIGARQGPQGKGKSLNNPQQPVLRLCPYKCGATHSALNCTELTRGQRITYIERNNACLNCLSTNHRVEQCTSRLSCLECTKRGIRADQCRHHTSTCPNLFDKSGKYFGNGSDYYTQGRKRKQPDAPQAGSVPPKVEAGQDDQSGSQAKTPKVEQSARKF